MARHKFFGGKLHVYKRNGGQIWQCYTYLDGKHWRESTRKESLAEAEDFAEDWYLGLRGKSRVGELKTGKTFAFVAAQFLKEYGVITQGQRSPKYVKNHEEKLRVHLLPYFGPMLVSEITPGTVQEYRIYRATTGSKARNVPEGAEPKPPSRSTMLQDIVTLRQVLKTAHRHGWLAFVPDLAPPYKTSGKIAHRAWFSPTEYRQLYLATRRRANDPLKRQWQWSCEQMHDYVLFMANTGLRPDEAARLEYRDVAVVKDRDTAQTILEIEVRGKRGVGYCKSTVGAVQPFLRLRKRNAPQPTDRLFEINHRQLFNTVLEEEHLKFDRDGNRRTAYSLRHTYICLRLMEGADIYQIAKNCRTSVEMIEKYYATHLKNTLDASAINVRRGKAWDIPPKKARIRKPRAKSLLAKHDD